MSDVSGQERKRRDRVEDSVGSTLYTADPLPPFNLLIKDLVYICYRAEPDRLQALLPPGLTPDPLGTVILTFYRYDIGWGFPYTSGGFFSPVVNEYPAADTSEACFFVTGVGSEPMATHFNRNFGHFRPGGSSITVSGRTVEARLWDDLRGDLVCARLERRDEPPTEMTANDRYLGLNAAGHLVSTVASVAGPNFLCDLTGVEIAASAPSEVQAMRPIEMVYGSHIPDMICNWAAPERLYSAAGDAAPGQAALLEILDRQARATLLVSSTGHVLHANSHGTRLLALVAPRHADPLRPEDAEIRTRFSEALRSASAGHRGGGSARFPLPRRDGTWPIIADIAPADPALAGPGAALILLSDPAQTTSMQDPAVLRLFGLTLAEARVAAAVGAGLPPREAARRLGLRESSVRSSLKIVYDKLGISRQSELVLILAKL